MTPKEKAEELIEKFDIKHNMKLIKGELPISMYKSQIKGCAILAVDEILEENSSYQDLVSVYQDKDRNWSVLERQKYWQEVKLELEK